MVTQVTPNKREIRPRPGDLRSPQRNEIHQLPRPDLGRIVAEFSSRTRVLLASGVLLLVTGCSTTNGVSNASGFKPVDVAPGSRGTVSGNGIAQHDIVAMTNQMARDMFASGFLARTDAPPRIQIDEQSFKNEGSQAINRKLITDRLRVELNRASQGRMVFVGRQYAAAVAEERDLKRAGIVDSGTTGLTKAAAGVDFRLGGTISTQDVRDGGSGVTQRYNQIIFELFDTETSEIVWSNYYEVTRESGDDVIYR